MKVLITASTFSHIVSFHLPYVRRFRELGWEVHIACGGAPRDIPGADRLVQLPLEKKLTAPGNLRASAILRRLMRENAYDLVLTHTSLAAFFTRFAELGLHQHPPTVNVVHGYLFDDNTPPLKAALLRSAEHLTAPVTDLLLTMNRYDYDWAVSHHAGKMVHMIPGIGVPDLSADSSVTEHEGFVLIYPAEFSERKNQSMLIRAMQLLPDCVKLVLPGSGALLDECRELSEHLGVSKRVYFPGHVDNVRELLCSSDAAVTASRSEGLPFNVMEAMQCALPVIASDVKGNTDLVQDGVTGLLFPFNDEATFARCVKRLMEDRATAAQMGQNGRAAVGKYELDNVLDMVMAEYLTLSGADGYEDTQ
ncbi:MAG: glycosyltransferase family 4 protein [Candidatus Limivicinus sp.]|nr:glycosyltransferase family 4 protein [Candidatus Limivicinus sp.]